MKLFFACNLLIFQFQRNDQVKRITLLITKLTKLTRMALRNPEDTAVPLRMAALPPKRSKLEIDLHFIRSETVLLDLMFLCCQLSLLAF